jgi:hypothetical protein
VFSWFFKYAYVLLDSVANGIDRPPVLSVEMLNPIDEQRPLAQLVVVGLIVWLAYTVGGWGAVVIGVIGLLYLPVSVAVLGASSRAIDAVNPVALTRVILGLGMYYPIILGVIAGYALVTVFVARAGAWNVVTIPLFLLFVLSIFSALGGALYDRRHELGLEPTITPERTSEKEDRERARLRARAFDTIYGEARGGNFMAARESTLAWLREAGPEHLANDARFFASQAREWQDDKAFAFMGRFLILHLLECGQTGVAVELAGGVMERAPTLKWANAADVLKVATLARAAGKRSLTLRLLAEFEQQFPADARTDEALALRSEAERSAATRSKPAG